MQVVYVMFPLYVSVPGLLALFCIINVSSTELHCTDALMEMSTDLVNVNTLRAGQRHYDNSQTCRWRIRASQPNFRFRITVLTLDLDFAPSNGICIGYDHVSVRDGEDATAPELAAICGDRNPRAMITSGAVVYIFFRSNSQNVYYHRGVVLRLQAYNHVTSCPPQWTYNNQTQRCLSVHNHVTKWAEAQRHCNYEQANLVSVASLTTQKFIAGLAHNSTGGQEAAIWIGLHDLSGEANYRWINPHQQVKYTNWVSPRADHQSERDCTALSARTGLWEAYNCERNLLRFICSMNPHGVQEIFPVPDNYEDKGAGNEGLPEWVIGVIVAAILAVAAVAVGVVVGLRRGTTCTCVESRRSSRAKYTGVRARGASGVNGHTSHGGGLGEGTRQPTVSAQPGVSADPVVSADTSQGLVSYRRDVSASDGEARIPSAPPSAHPSALQAPLNNNIESQRQGYHLSSSPQSTPSHLTSQHVAPPTYEDSFNDRLHSDIPRASFI